MTHAALAIEAVQTGLPILVEKPMAPTSDSHVVAATDPGPVPAYTPRR
ncbi:hypothetical protein ACE41H_15510 [Paenibacillus enshidis]|uniref:Gfo/Idh/MocA-like oxidoreductase N-terminal domain-containing protein n=1 Tax=Paenibacillus enshidis TaxID=1458439 RepID=A0ABV5AWA8_9BACL